MVQNINTFKRVDLLVLLEIILFNDWLYFKNSALKHYIVLCIVV